MNKALARREFTKDNLYPNPNKRRKNCNKQKKENTKAILINKSITKEEVFAKIHLKL